MNPGIVVLVRPAKWVSLLGNMLPALAALSLGGCVEVNGGAVELSWTIRDDEGNACSCGRSGIETVELQARRCDTFAGDGTCLTTDADGNPAPAALQALDSWPCDALRGSTPFDVREGRWAFEIAALDEQDNEVRAREPSPIIRDVLSGEVAHLDALLIELEGACP